MIVLKLDHTGREVWRYQAEQLHEEPHLIVVKALFNRDDLQLGYTTFRRGDRFVEVFYNDRWYNVFAVYDRDSSHLKGWYCNICRPATWDNETISCEDLALDVWVDPDGQTLIMDEEEFTALDLSLEERRHSREALAQLLALGRQKDLPR